MQNRVALGSPSLQRADHAASSVASTVSVPPGHPGDARLWWIPFESYPTNLSHTEPLIRWLWAGPAMLERAVLIMLLFVLLDLSSKPLTQRHHKQPPSEAPNIPCLKAFFGGWYPSKQLTWAHETAPPSHLLYQARFRNVSQAPGKKSKVILQVL